MQSIPPPINRGGRVVQEIRLSDRALTLRRRRDVHFANNAEEQRAAESAKKFLADSFSWQYDAPLMSQLQDMLNLKEPDARNARWKVQRAIESGELVTIPDAPSSGLTGRRGSDTPRPRSMTFTPSQLFKGAPRLTSCVREYVPRALSRLPADDFFAIMAAKPGDVLPNGDIAKPFAPEVLDASELEALRQRVIGNAGASDSGSLFERAEPFEYAPDTLSGDVEELAASTSNPNYAAKMLGYDRKTFGDILHKFKPGNGLGPADNVIWHDSGDVYFKGDYIGNSHDWAD
jgi:hypothetical protein